jgi:hypothetical protein
MTSSSVMMMRTSSCHTSICSNKILSLGGGGTVINKRDHLTGDGQIRADYFGPNPVYSPMHFRRRYVLKLHNIYDMAILQ